MGGMKELTKICPNCGKSNLDSAKFCDNCGDELKNVKPAMEPKSNGLIGGFKDWWNKLSTNEKAISGLAACCIGVFLLVMVVGALAPDPTHLSVSTVNAQIDDKVTEYIINGTADPKAKVYITSSSLNLTNVEVAVDNKTGNFQYKLNIPVDVTDLSVDIIATASGKLNTSQTVNIQRPLTPLTVNPTSTLKQADKTVIIEGTTDPQAEVEISSSDLGINATKVKVDSKGKFKYTVNVPSDISSASVSITTKSVGKRANTHNEYIVRESPPPPTTTDTNTVDTGSASDSGPSSSSTGSSSSSSNRATGTFVGSINSDVYHYPSCASAKRIHSENLITFNSVTEAKNAGYRPCKTCHPPG